MKYVTDNKICHDQVNAFILKKKKISMKRKEYAGCTEK